jgi:hypothetical protein
VSLKIIGQIAIFDEHAGFGFAVRARWVRFAEPTSARRPSMTGSFACRTAPGVRWSGGHRHRRAPVSAPNGLDWGPEYALAPSSSSKTMSTSQPRLAAASRSAASSCLERAALEVAHQHVVLLVAQPLAGDLGASCEPNAPAGPYGELVAQAPGVHQPGLTERLPDGLPSVGRCRAGEVAPTGLVQARARPERAR